mgnify:CR=1 FL=1
MTSIAVPLPIHNLGERSQFMYNLKKNRWYGEALKHENSLSKVWVRLDNYSMFPNYLRLQDVSFGYVLKDWDYDTSYVKYTPRSQRIGSNIVGVVMSGVVINKNTFEKLYTPKRTYSQAMNSLFSGKWNNVGMCFPNLTKTVYADEDKYREVFERHNNGSINSHLKYEIMSEMNTIPPMVYGTYLNTHAEFSELGVLVDETNSTEKQDELRNCFV